MTPKRIHKNQINALSVIRYLAAYGQSTQIQITNTINLRRTSVFNIFELMEQAKLLEVSSNVATMKKGRPRQLWQLNGSLGAFVCIYSGPHNRVLQLSDFNGALLENIVSLPQENMERELDEIVGILLKWAGQYRICGIMMILPGRIDFENRMVRYSKSWELENYPLCSILHERIGHVCPDALILVENNTRMTAWGLRYVGNGAGMDNFLVLSILNGQRSRHQGRAIPISIGSGAVLSGRIYRGHTGGAGELDHSCYTWWHRLYANNKFPVTLRELDHESREYFAEKLGENFAHLVNYLEPERVIVVFEQQPAEDFFSTLRKAIYKHLIYIDKENLDIELSSDGAGYTVRGGLALLRECYFGDDRNLIDLCGRI